jgi:hypothetical protein
MSDVDILSVQIVKDINNINLQKPKNLDCIKDDINIIKDTTEDIIKKYIKRIIYTSNLPDTINSQINEVFKEIKKTSKLI